MQFNYSPAVQCVGGCNSNIRITEQSCSKNTPLSIYIATLNELVINWDQFLFFFFLSIFAKLQKATISFVMSVRPSLYLRGTT